MFVRFCENREAVQKSSCFNVLYLIILPSASPTAIERWPQGSLMCILGGSPRETRREKEKKRNKKNKKNKKGRRRQSRKTVAACVARFAVTTY